MEILFVVAALLAGATLPLQAGVNAALRTHVGRPEWASLVSFAVGSAAIATWVAVGRVPAPTLAALGRTPWWAWTGGFLGAIYVTSVVWVTPRLGVAATLALTVAGQMVAALAIDQFGALGLASRPLNGTRLLGALLLVGGVALVRR